MFQAKIFAYVILNDGVKHHLTLSDFHASRPNKVETAEAKPGKFVRNVVESVNYTSKTITT